MSRQSQGWGMKACRKCNLSTWKIKAHSYTMEQIQCKLLSFPKLPRRCVLCKRLHNGKRKAGKTATNSIEFVKYRRRRHQATSRFVLFVHFPPVSGRFLNELGFFRSNV